MLLFNLFIKIENFSKKTLDGSTYLCENVPCGKVNFCLLNRKFKKSASILDCLN